MNISYNWIKDWIPTLTASPQEVANVLSRSLAEVESVVQQDGDWVLTIENKALNHRADLYGQAGLAIEIAAALNQPLVTPAPKALDQPTGKIDRNIKVNVIIDDFRLCPRYTGVIINGIKVTESPEWLINRLYSVGLRPINNIVDVTNYLMYKYGQPLHAFDLNKLQINQQQLNIGIRLAKTDEALILLDGKVLTLTNKDLVITNTTDGKDVPIALAGIMGGKSAEISANTNAIFLEAANFDMYAVRANSRRHAVRSDASLRFEKGIDPELTLTTILEAIYMITGGSPDDHAPNDIIDTRDIALPTPQTQILIANTEINSYLNINQTIEQNRAILNRLSIPSEINGNEILISFPSHRKDLKIKEDIFEEIGRIYDYNKIEPTVPTRLLTPKADNVMWNLKNKIRDFLTRAGADEVLTYTFVDEKQAGLWSSIENDHIVMKHDSENTAYHLVATLSPELSYVRSSLIPSLNQATIENAKRFSEFTIFEINPVTIYSSRHSLDEPEMLAIVHYRQGKSWVPTVKHIRAIWEQLTTYLGLPKDFVGILPLRLKIPDDKGLAFAYEIDLRSLVDISRVPQAQTIPASPPAYQDLSFFVNADLNIGAIIKVIQNTVDALLQNVELIDIYQNQQMLKENQKSVTLRLHFQSQSRSLSDQELNPIRTSIANQIIKEFGAIIR